MIWGMHGPLRRQSGNGCLSIPTGALARQQIWRREIRRVLGQWKGTPLNGTTHVCIQNAPSSELEQVVCHLDRNDCRVMLRCSTINTFSGYKVGPDVGVIEAAGDEGEKRGSV